MKSIVLAAGCFWGVQAYFKLVKGVKSTTVGYIQGTKDFPSYSEVLTDSTGHAESCLIKYDSEVTNLAMLLEHYFNIIEGKKDRENRLRNGIYYRDEEEKYIINSVLEQKFRNKKINKIAIEVEKANEFWEAEEYHQDYLEKNMNGFCHIPNEKFLFSSKIDEKQCFK